jgi:hypothetical protein
VRREREEIGEKRGEEQAHRRGPSADRRRGDWLDPLGSLREKGPLGAASFEDEGARRHSLDSLRFELRERGVCSCLLLGRGSEEALALGHGGGICGRASLRWGNLIYSS